MDYININKKAWNEVYNRHKIFWDKNPIINNLKSEKSFLNQDMLNALEVNTLKGKCISQFCCNNGRELIYLVNRYECKGIGFDISDEFIDNANSIASQMKLDCSFVCTDILNFPSPYIETFDTIFSTIGTICWFKDLELFFKSVSKALKPNGIFVLNETHVFMNCFAMSDEDRFDSNNPEKIVYSYFKNDPWISNSGMDYLSGIKYASETFTSFSHTMSDIINAMVNSGIAVKGLFEYKYALHEFKHIENKLLPVSMILIGIKG